MKIQWFIHSHTNDLVILAAIRSTLAGASTQMARQKRQLHRPKPKATARVGAS